MRKMIIKVPICVPNKKSKFVFGNKMRLSDDLLFGVKHV